MQALVVPLIYNLYPLNGLESWEILNQYMANHPLWQNGKHGGKCVQDKGGGYPCLQCVQGLLQAIGTRFVEKLVKQYQKDIAAEKKFIRKKEYFLNLSLLEQREVIEKLLGKNKLFKQYLGMVKDSCQN